MAGKERSPSADDTLGEVASILGVDRDQMDAEPKAALLHDLVTDMAARGHDRDGPIRETFARIGDRWCMLILLVLRSGPFHYAALRRLVTAVSAEKAISQRMLTLRLRSLERNGFVRRTDLPTRPRSVEYALTPLGADLTDRAFDLIKWIGGQADGIEKARKRFDHENR